jgi:hypothetical protein
LPWHLFPLAQPNHSTYAVELANHAAWFLLSCCHSDGCFISKGYDATTHFETTVDDVLDMYKRITGKDIDLDSKDPRLAQQQE